MGVTQHYNSKLSKTISHALRHEPWLYELELDDEGWVPVPQVVEALQRESVDWINLTEDAIAEMIHTSEKQRHEIANGRIRAIYGHSIPCKLKRDAATPPEILFHGTRPEAVTLIKVLGLKPMRRQNVHLSVDEVTAIEVGKRKSKTPTVLRVLARRAHAAGVVFYQGNDKVWLADEVPPPFIEF